MNRRKAFPPVLGGSPKILILGSMPGEESLRQARYYAHPKNAFWPILGELLGFDPNAPYDTRLDALKEAGIALWDVLESCVRPGSMDSDIKHERTNNFKKLFERNPGIALVVFNGCTAERLFIRRVAPGLKLDGVEFRKAPSTSPAFASLRFEEKLRRWRLALGYRDYP